MCRVSIRKLRMLLLFIITYAATAAAASSSASNYDPTTTTSDESKNIIYEIPLAVLILTLYIVLGHGLEIWKDHQEAAAAARSVTQPSNRNSPPKPLLCTFHESGPAILLGLAVGLLMNYGAGKTFEFDSNVFFYVVLPPIIFHQGYAFKKRNFFRYLSYIFGFGILGTLVQFVIISVLCFYLSNQNSVYILSDDGVAISLSIKQCMIIASIFCAADEVATLSLIKQTEYPKLSAILFGEGVMNDALSILLFHAVTSIDAPDTSGLSGLVLLQLFFRVIYLCITAAGVGLGSGLLVSILLKSIPSLQMNSVRQTAILMLGGYFSFSLSEAMDLSGVLTVFFCGLTLSHYAWHSLGTEAQVASKITSDTISMIAEAYCFAAIGLSVHEFNANQWCFGFVGGMIVVLMVARAVGVYGFCLVRYLISPGSFKMPIAEQNVLYFGGLVRGAISWAQVMQVYDTHRSVMVTTTLGVVLFTIVVFGSLMPLFTRHLTPEEEEETSRKPPPQPLSYRIDQSKPINGGDNGYAHTTDLGLDAEEGIKEGVTASLWPKVRENVLGGGERPHRLPPPVLGKVHKAWAWFDDNFMKPVFGGSSVRHGSIYSGSHSNNSVGTMRVDRKESRTRTYSGITRIIPQSYGSSAPTENGAI